MEASKKGEKCLDCSTTEDLVLVGSYWMCQSHKDKRVLSNAKNNGTEKFYDSLRKHNRKKAAAKLQVSEGSLIVIPIETRFETDHNHFRESLSAFKQLIAGKRVAVWDTESDGVGGTHTLSMTREWCFQGVDDNDKIHIRRYLNDIGYDSNAGTDLRTKNPAYTDEFTAIAIKDFIDRYDLVFAFEPKSCDRNRLKELFDKSNPDWYPAIQHKLMDFSRDCIKSICHTKYNEQKYMVYLTDICQPTIWEYLLNDKRNRPDYFLETPVDWAKIIAGICRKCEMDVNILKNMFLYIRNFVINQQ
jgi:hypothetical protein